MSAFLNARQVGDAVRWRIASALLRLEWQHIMALGFGALWTLLVALIDLPLRAETRHIGMQFAPFTAQQSAKLSSSEPRLARRDVSREFTTSLPDVDKQTEELRALNEIAVKANVAVKRIEYRYENLSGIPIRKMTLHMEIRGDEMQLRRYLQLILNSFPNMSVARLAYSRNGDGSARVEQRLDVNMYYRLALEAAA